MPKFTTTPEAMQLWLEGQIALAEVEHEGCRIDKSYLEQTLADTLGKIRDIEGQLRSDPIYKKWQRRYGEKTNLGAPDQLAGVVYGELGYTGEVKTTGGKRGSASKKALETLGTEIPFVKLYFQAQELRKLHGTYLGGIQRELVQHADGLWYVHPSYNLNRVITSRSSCVAKGTIIEIVRDVSKTPKGVPIEDVREGDYVYCYDDSLNLAVRRVKWAGKTGRKKLVRIHWSSPGKSGTLDVTADHKIRLSSGKYVSAGSLLGRPLTRGLGESQHRPRCSVLAMGRTSSRLWQTGKKDAILDHRLVYSSVVGPLEDHEVVHHRDGNHLNNTPTNLQKMSGQPEHAKHHAPDVLTDDVRRMGIAERKKNHELYGDRWKSREDAANWISISKWQVLRILAAHGGSPTEVRNRGLMDFNTFKSKMRLCGVDQPTVRRRYDGEGKYITRGMMVRAAGGIHAAAKSLRVGYYNAKKMYQERGIDPGCGVGKGNGRKVHNHAIIRVEELSGMYDVYDLSVEGSHNYIANEICVHNCDSPNYQNVYSRDPEFAGIVRKCYIPKPGCQLGELDLGQIEVRVPAPITRDPNLIAYVTDPDKDMHRDMAMQIFFLTAKQVSKAARHAAKNQAVFPMFYGSYYAQCAPNIWQMIDSLKIKVEGTETLLQDHLASKGITSLGACDPDKSPVKGTFEYHMKQIEDDFWGNRFPVYAQWKKDWWASYQRYGGYQMITGFAVNVAGLDKKQVCNGAIQGPAFHLNLWSMVRMVRLLRKYKMKSRVIGEIHDCQNYNLFPKERNDVLELGVRVMTQDVKKWATWMTVPITAEPEICPVSAPWFDKVGLKNVDGQWVPSDMDKWTKKYGDWSLQG